MLLFAGCAPAEVPVTSSSFEQAPTVTVSLSVRPGIRDLVAPVVATDPQGEPLSVSYAWTRNGEATSFDQGSVPATEVWPGDEWVVTVTATDPDGNWDEDSAAVVIAEPLGGNVLVIVLDDVGVDKLTMYGLFDGAPTPVLDSLAAQGARFTAAWAYPTCSPMRAAALSGRHPYRHGTGHFVDMATSSYVHPIDSVFIPSALHDARGAGPWTSVALGKWHLAGDEAPNHLRHPMDLGFASFAGSPGYLNESVVEYQGYFIWRKNVDGVAETSTLYNTTDTVNDVLTTLPDLPQPWFAWVSFNAAHTPYHTPPAELFTQPLPEEPTSAEKYEAMLEALDTELGRMLNGLSELLPQTTLFVIGDNGTSDLVATEFSPSQAKGTVFEGGVRVPLIVVSPHLVDPGRVIDTPVMAVDLFPTILDLAGVPLGDGDGGLVLPRTDGASIPLDGVSWVSLLSSPAPTWVRSHVYTELLKPNGPPPWGTHTRAVSDGRYKLHRNMDGEEEMYDLWSMDGLDQTDDLLRGRLNDEEERAYAVMSALLDTTGLDTSYVGY